MIVDLTCRVAGASVVISILMVVCRPRRTAEQREKQIPEGYETNHQR